MKKRTSDTPDLLVGKGKMRPLSNLWVLSTSRPLSGIVLLLFLLTASLSGFQPVRAQQTGALPVSNAGITYEFGTSITFQAQISLPSPATEANLLFRADGEQNTRIIPIQIDAQGNTQTRYDMSQGKVRPFSTVFYQYQVKLQSGDVLNSQQFNFQYEDNRFKWQVTTGEGITIHWYTGELDFGQKALDVARRREDGHHGPARGTSLPEQTPRRPRP